MRCRSCRCSAGPEMPCVPLLWTTHSILFVYPPSIERLSSIAHDLRHNHSKEDVG